MTDDTAWVYVFARKLDDKRLSGPVKVGISNDVNARLKGIQTACPYDIDIAYVFECPSRFIARDVERSFHATQSGHQLRGEWFDLEPVKAIHLLCLLFRTKLDQEFKDDHETIEGGLHLTGVLWAEKRFKLVAPDMAGVH